MRYRQINTEKALKKIMFKDNLFRGNYTIDPYQNCEFGCRYCDSTYSDTIYIKENILNKLKLEIKSISKDERIIIGSVHDPYQPVEKDFELTRKIIELLEKENISYHILTKSDLILRDKDIISSTNENIVTISISALDKRTVSIFEGKIISPKERMNIIKLFTDAGVKSGLAIMPILPYITDQDLKEIFKIAHEKNIDYILCKYLELKGDQKRKFFDIIKLNYDNLFEKYQGLYKDSYKPDDKYISNLKKAIGFLSEKYSLKLSI